MRSIIPRETRWIVSKKQKLIYWLIISPNNIKNIDLYVAERATVLNLTSPVFSLFIHFAVGENFFRAPLIHRVHKQLLWSTRIWFMQVRSMHYVVIVCSGKDLMAF